MSDEEIDKRKDMPERIGFIGLGQIGFPIARRLAEQGFQLIVHNRSHAPVLQLVEHGAEEGSYPGIVAEKAEITFTCLPGNEACEDVYLANDGICSGDRSGKIFVELGTISPAVIRRIYECLLTKGAHFLDAGVSGGIKAAEKGTLSVMVGGRKESLERVKYVLEHIAQKIFYVGEPGLGMTAKIVNNLISHVNASIAIEGLLLGTKAGINPLLLMEIIHSSSGDSRILWRFEKYVRQGEFDEGMRFDLLYKDSALALELGKEVHVPLFVASAAHNIFELERALGMGLDNWAKMITVWEKMLNLRIGGMQASAQQANPDFQGG